MTALIEVTVVAIAVLIGQAVVLLLGLLTLDIAGRLGGVVGEGLTIYAGAAHSLQPLLQLGLLEELRGLPLRIVLAGGLPRSSLGRHPVTVPPRPPRLIAQATDVVPAELPLQRADLARAELRLRVLRVLRLAVEGARLQGVAGVGEVGDLLGPDPLGVVTAQHVHGGVVHVNLLQHLLELTLALAGVGLQDLGGAAEVGGAVLEVGDLVARLLGLLVEGLDLHLVVVLLVL